MFLLPKKSMKRATAGLVALFMISMVALNLANPLASAATQNLTKATRLSFTFDDGLATTYTNAAPTLKKYGLTGTNYVATSCIGMTTVPNNCRANTDVAYMTWAQVTALRSTYGWEIGSHTATHPYLATSDASDGQPKVLTPSQVTTELTGSKAALAAHGINAEAFAPPYGDYNNAVLSQVAKYYTSMRGFADQNINVFPYNDYILQDYHVEGTTTVAQVKARIDQAVTNKEWLVLTFHSIKTTGASTNPDDYEWSTAKLDAVAAYAATKRTAGALKSVNISQGLVSSDTNLLPNSSFNSGIAQGWTTDSASIVANSLGNGSFPDTTRSIKLTSTTKNAHLFAPKVTVDPNTNYILKNYLNVQSVTNGSVIFYIDEYNANGNWISGQYKNGESSAFVENMNFTYKPSSRLVSKASLQVIVTANSGITAYLDNSQWFATTTTVAPPVANLVANGTFDSGVGAGWTTNNTTSIVADSANHGSPANPVNSVRLTASTAGNTHLFSPKVTVDSTKTYIISCWLNLLTRTSGEIGYYVDEYDTNGNWISGQYKVGTSALGVQTVGFSYTPSSVNVKSASLQIIVVGNSGITGYVDNVVWALN